MEAYLKPLTKPCAKKIYEQIENYLYRINEKEGNYEIGYFIQLKDKNNKNYLYLITNSNVLKDIDNNSLKITINNESKSIELGDFRYEEKKYEKAVIEIKNNNDIKYFFEIDETIFKNEKDINMIYNKESIYIIQYDNKDNILVSYGIINEICGKDIKYSVNINRNIKDNIILNLNNNKIIGMLIDKSKNYNEGTFINDLIDQFIYKNKNIFSNINIMINIDKREVNKNIYFLDNYYYDKNWNKIEDKHEHLEELDENNTELYINGNKRKFEKYFIPEKEGEYIIDLKFNKNLTDCSYMFSGCENIKYIHFSNFNTSNVNNMKYMFSCCESLNTLTNISNLDTTNVNNMSYMFYLCKSLNSLPDISNWDTANVNDMSYMFSGCESLNSLPDISNWDTADVNSMSDMFSDCKSLNFLPDISKWNMSSDNELNFIFSGCASLISLPDISIWNTINVNNISYMFNNCKSLISLPDISIWNKSNVNNISYTFFNCRSLNSLPDISKWNTSNVKDMSFMFFSCKSLISLPDISKWNTSNVEDLSDMFLGCNSLISLPDISKWNTINVDDMSDMFYECISSLTIPKEFVK